jgi:hypothetical protein
MQVCQSERNFILLQHACCSDVVDDTPVFGQIETIFVQDMTFLLDDGLSFIIRSTSGAYSVHPTGPITVSHVNQLFDYYPLSAYRVKLQRYIVLQNFVYDHDQFTDRIDQ